MNKLFVYLVKLLSPVWRKLGANPKAVALILDAKLKMDDRGGYVMGQRQAPKSGMEFLVFVFMFFFGCMTIGAFFLFERPADALAVIFSFWLIYIGLMLVMELSNNLFDTRDLYQLLTRPITDATLSIARTLHIGVFTAKFALCLGLPVFVFMIFYYGIWSAFAFFLAGLSMVMITLVLTLGVYLLLLRYAPAHKVKKWVGYVQIFLATTFFTLYQLPNIMAGNGLSESVESLQITGSLWGYLFPGFWVGALWDSLTHFSLNAHTLSQSALALLATVGGFSFYVRQSSGYGQQLMDMDRAGSAPDTETNQAKPGKYGWFQPRAWIGNLLTKTELERASLNFHWRMMQRDMDFKQRTYPNIAIFPVMMLGLIGKSAFDGTDDNFSSAVLLTEGRWVVLTLLYTLVIMVITPNVNTKASKSYKASWIFLATPIVRSGAMQYGQFLAVLGMFFSPLAILIYLGLLLHLGPTILPDLLLTAGVVATVSLIVVGLDKNPPFSQAVDNGNMNSLGAVLLSFFMTGILGVGHYFIGKIFPWAIILAAGLLWLLVLFQVRALRRS